MTTSGGANTLNTEAPARSPLRDTITLTGITAQGFHGVFEDERRNGQPFVVDVVLHADLRPAGLSDDLAQTAHYGELEIGRASCRERVF